MRLPKPVRELLRTAYTRLLASYVNAVWRLQHSRATPHTLPGTVAITLTSYPPRFETLALTLKSLLAQDMRPDHLYLWIAEGDLAQLPAEVRRLERHGLEIKACDNLRSYKKIIPALEDDLAEFFVTADDDQYYPHDWFGSFVRAYRPGENEVLCGRAHEIRLDVRGLPLPYMQWDFDVAADTRRWLLFPTGIGGVFYRRGIFHHDVTRRDVFLRLCPSADDVWLFWMASLRGARVRKVGRKRRAISWENTQHVALFAQNRTANDHQIAAMIARYGFPVSS